MTKCLAAVLAIAAAGCPSVKATETTVPPFDGPTVEFDPAHSIIPFPNNLVLDPTTGKVNLPAPCNESATAMALRTGVLNKLDGFGTFEAAMQATTNAPNAPDAVIDMTTVMANVVMYQRTNGATPLDPASAQKIPIDVSLGTTTRFTSGCASTETVNSITVVPLVPLFEKSTYTVAVLDGLANTSGVKFLPSPTWSLVRQPVNPVTLDSTGNVVTEQTPLDLASCPQPVASCAMASDPAVMQACPQLAQICGIDQLWTAHDKALTFLVGTGVVPDRTHVTVAWEVTTQTTTDPLDPTIAGSPANVQGSTPLLFTQSVVPAGGCNPGQGCTAFLTGAGLPCGAGALPCNFVGDVLGAGLTTIPFQVPNANAFDSTRPIAGQWTDPEQPMAQSGWPLSMSALQVIAVVPNPTALGLANPPATGWPTVVFGHGLGSRKETMLAIAPQLARAGFASIAIDFQAHGSRAVQITSDATLGCSGNCSTTTTTACHNAGGCPAGEQCINAAGAAIDPTVTHQCFAPFLSTDLGATRDNIRQTVLDLQRLVRAAKACGPSSCTASNDGTPLTIDPNHIVYAGISLGGIIGSTTTAVEPDFKAAVLNVSAMGLADILENSSTLDIVCPLVDALIDAGVVMGDKWNQMEPPNATGLCTTPAWKAQPGYQQFAQAARWILDPADGANFAEMLAPKRYLLMEVVMDQVVPNVATDDEGALLGRTFQMADIETGAACTFPTNCASAAITTNPSAPKWVRYANLPAASPFPGNTFQHASLLQPAPTANMDPQDNDGKLGTLRVQTDAITYLFNNK